MFRLFFILLFISSSSSADVSQYVDVKKCTPFVDTIIDKKEIPQNPGDVFKLAERYCQKGSKMHIESIPEWWVQYVIYNVCEMKHTVHVACRPRILQPHKARGPPGRQDRVVVKLRQA